MKTRSMRLLGLALLTALAAALTFAAVVGARDHRSQGADRGVKTLTANLRGKAEVPGPGDADGRGQALVRVRPNAGTVCFRLRIRRIATPTAAHIHRGRRGEAGDVVVTLFSGEPRRRGCVEGLDQALLRDIRRHPRRFYVNVHNAEFPNGAIRGQLNGPGRHRRR